MAFTTGMSKEGKKLMNSTDEKLHKDIEDLLSPADKIIVQTNIKKETEKMLKQLKTMGFRKMFISIISDYYYLYYISLKPEFYS